jgi:CheY-like chemotaxis protein
VEAPATTPPRAARRALLVEDNRVNQEVGRAMLRALGFDTEISPDGRAGVEAAFSRDYDIILMDCQMPEMDGFEATAEIRAREQAARSHGSPTRRTIIALTANAMQGDRERCLEAGMDDYLAKPFRKDQLERVLAKWAEDAHALERETAAA